jgi:hypothetical protein
VLPQQKDPRFGGLFSKNIKTMNDLFVISARTIYYAEKQLVKALPKMADKRMAKSYGSDASGLVSSSRKHFRG